MKLKVLIIGGTGYIGKRLVKASLDHGHETYVLQRSVIGRVDVEKVQMLLSFKKQGARLLIGSFNDHRSLVEAVKQVDVVICTISGDHHQLLLQLKLVDAIKEAGNIKRFLPSEFGANPARMADAMEQGRQIFDDKMVVRKAIEDAGIPFTYVSANCFAGIFVGGLCQIGHFLPSRESVVLFGDGNKKWRVAMKIEEQIDKSKQGRKPLPKRVEPLKDPPNFCLFSSVRVRKRVRPPMNPLSLPFCHLCGYKGGLVRPATRPSCCC